MKNLHWLALTLACVVNPMNAQTAEANPKAMALRTIMADLGRATEQTSAAISLEDWPAVVLLSQKLAVHPEPPTAEKVRILTYLGPDAGQFKAFDLQTHAAATAMGEAAQTKDGKGVIDQFARLQTACLGCHQSFRTRFRQHFYNQKAQP